METAFVEGSFNSPILMTKLPNKTANMLLSIFCKSCNKSNTLCS